MDEFKMDTFVCNTEDTESRDNESPIGELNLSSVFKSAVAVIVLLVAFLSLGIPYIAYILGRDRGTLINILFIVFLVFIAIFLVMTSMRLVSQISRYVRNKNYVG